MRTYTYYTVIIGKTACLVKYASGPAYEVKLFQGTFADPGEASQQFKKTRQDTLEYRTEEAFLRKVSQLAYVYQQQKVKLVEWQALVGGTR